MDAKGIIHGMRNQSDLDEAASAYKDIDQVIALESDLVKVKTKLEPIAVIKGWLFSAPEWLDSCSRNIE